MEKVYTAGLMSQSFWFVETKAVIKLLHEGKAEAEIKELCLQHNLFGAAKEYRARRMYGYIWNRVKSMDTDLIELFCASDVVTQKLIILIAILKTDRLFFEFLFEVYREKVILGAQTLEKSDVNIFFKNKEVQSEEIEKWIDTTKRKLCGVYFNFMTDANLLTVVDKEKRITPPILDDALERYLKKNGDHAIIKAITGVN